MNANNNSELRYDAFISYRHSELDKFVAEELHKQLESFKVPKKVAKNIGRKRINRIFRDKDELPITSNLADPIINALKVSDFLIVICSPRLNESLWCKREIENFIAMHGQERVLAVLIEGEPKDSFPSELLYRERTITLENGETRIVKEPVEPLAADVRGKSKKEIKKQIKTEILRLLAPMLQCNYDDLKQRHRERRMQRILALASAICVVGLTFGTVSTVMALQIKSQKEQIDQQYLEIKDQKAQIDEQYWEALETNAKMSSENALELLDKGDRIGAICMARELLPDDLENQNIPYTPEAFFALTESVYPYANGGVLCPIFQIKADAEISDIILDDEGNRVCVRTKYDQLIVWDVPNKEKCLDVDMNTLSSYSIYDNGIVFLGNDRIALLCYEKIMILALEDNVQGEISQSSEYWKYGFPHELLSDSQGKYLVIVFEDAVCVYDANTLKEIQTYENTEDMENIYGKARFYGDNQLIFCQEAKEDGAANLNICIADLENGQITKRFEVPYGDIAEVEATKDSVFIAVNTQTAETTNIFEMEYDGDVYCFDLNTGAKRWTYHMDDDYINGIVKPYTDYDCFLIESYAQIISLEKEKGELIGVFNFGSEIVNIFPLQTPDKYLVYKRDGSYATLVPEENYNVEVVGEFISATDNIKQFEWGNGFMMSVPYLSKELIVYSWYEDPQMEVIYEFEDNVNSLVISEDGKYSLIENWEDELLIIDNEKQEITNRIACESYIISKHFIDNDKIQVLCNQKVFIYDLQGKLLDSFEIGEDYLSIEHVSADGKYAYGHDYEALLKIECSTGNITKCLTKEQCGYGANVTYTFSNNGDKCVILDKTQRQCRLYDTSEGSLITSIDINATYIESVQFSEYDEYVYIVYEDGIVEQYHSEDMSLKCQVTDLEYGTEKIYEKVIDGDTKYYFVTLYGAYILDDYDGKLKVEQFVPQMEDVNISQNEYWILDYKTLMSVPIYTYEEMLGKADQICYDNSLWNN